MKVRNGLIGAGPNFYMICGKANVSLGFCGLSFLHSVNDAQGKLSQKRLVEKAYVPVEWNYMGTMTKTCINPAGQNQFIQERFFNNTPIRRIAITMNSNSASIGSFAENPFWYQEFNLRDIRIRRGGQPIVNHDTTDNCRLYVTMMKAINCQDEVPIDNFEDHYVLLV